MKTDTLAELALHFALELDKPITLIQDGENSLTYDRKSQDFQVKVSFNLISRHATLEAAVSHFEAKVGKTY
jgi:hypothetical protein